MPSSTTTPTPATDDSTAAPVFLSRRERIAAERAAAAGGTAVAAPLGDAAPVPATMRDASPVTPQAPASPVLPASAVGPATPPAPVSPTVAPAAERVETTPTTPVAVPVAAPFVAREQPAPTAESMQAAARVRRIPRVTARPVARPVVRPARTRGSSFRRAASGVTALGALVFVAGFIVSSSVPAQALWVPEAASNQRAVVAGASQSITVGDITDGSTSRDAYTISDPTRYQNTDSSTFTNDANGTIQWPFLTGVPITSGFGGRQVEGCSFCSTFHEGVDFAPGEGTPIRVIADGTVIKVQADDGGYGNDVWVEHDVDGKQFVSVYGHMKDNSFKVVEGQAVKVGDELGEVGSTGNSTGPHLHLEIHVNDVPVDPLAWLRANAN